LVSFSAKVIVNELTLGGKVSSCLLPLRAFFPPLVIASSVILKRGEIEWRRVKKGTLSKRFAVACIDLMLISESCSLYADGVGRGRRGDRIGDLSFSCCPSMKGKVGVS